MSTVKWTADVEISNHGSIFLFQPMNTPAKDWLKDNTDGQWFGSALVVEHRYAEDLAQGLQDNGFTVE